jgi:hypothetical protein
MNLYIAVHHNEDPPAGAAITLATEAALPGGWVLGGERPATHAFVVVETEHLMWRLDGEPPVARTRPFAGWRGYGMPLAAWRIVPTLWVNPIGPPVQVDVRAGVARMRALDGTGYDWFEIGGQVAGAFGNVVNLLRASVRLTQIPGLDHVTTARYARGAMICTRVACEVLRACGAAWPALVDGMPDLFPERLAQLLRAQEGAWTERVV